MAIDGGWFVYAGAPLDYVHNQLVINGNTFRDSPSTRLRHDQYDIFAGISYSWHGVNMSISYQEGSAPDTNATSREEFGAIRSEEHTSELQSRENLVCRLLLEKKNENEHVELRI